MKRVGVILLMLVGALNIWPAQRSSSSIADIQNIFVIYRDGWSFDSLFGQFPGANGIEKADDAVRQVNKDGKRYTTLPQPLDTRNRPPSVDARFPANLPVAPFDLSTFVKPDEQTGDLIQRFYQQQFQFNNGKMDKFVAWSDGA